MKRILEKLNSVAGIRGSMVMTQDGIMVASALGQDQEEDVVAALASSLLTTVSSSLRTLTPEETLTQFVLSSSDGKMIFVNLENAYLVVLAKQDMVLDTTLVDIRSAAHHIKNRAARLQAQTADPASAG